MKGGYTMRSFYTDNLGFTADLCEFLDGAYTRLTVRNPDGQAFIREVYPTWDAALDVLRSITDCWTNDLTHQPLA